MVLIEVAHYAINGGSRSQSLEEVWLRASLLEDLGPD
jgi:hypothetical protein